MKKIIIGIGILLLILPFKVYARCDYQEVIDLNKLASNVEYEYEYNSNNGTFKLIFYNVVADIMLQTDTEVLSTLNNVASVSGLKPGSRVITYVKLNKYTECEIRVDLRLINITLPFINPYYKTQECVGYENLTVCNSQFLGYQITHKILERAKESQDNPIIIKPPAVEEEGEAWYESMFDFFKDNFIPMLLVLITTAISIVIANNILRRIKHGI